MVGPTKHRWRWSVVALGLATLVALTGCEVEWPGGNEFQWPRIPGIQPEIRYVTVPVPQPSQPQQSLIETTKAYRGAIAEVVKMTGQVISAREATLYFRASGQLDKLHVETHQRVDAGQMLAELDMEVLENRREKAQQVLAQTQLRLEQVQGKSLLSNPADAQAAVEVASIKVRIAKLALDEVRANAYAVEIKTAEAAVASAQANLERLDNDLVVREAALKLKEAELAARQAGPSAEDEWKARQTLRAAQLQAEAVRTGTRPEDRHLAELALDVQRTRLSQLRDAPPVQPEDLNVARLAVEQAQVNLDAALADRAGKQGSNLASAEANVRLGQLALEAAYNNLTKMQTAGPSPWTIRLQELAVQQAQNTIQKLAAPHPLDVQLAEIALQQAQTRLDTLLSGSSQSELQRLRDELAALRRSLAAAQAARPSAAAALAAAQARLAQVRQGPSAAAIKQKELGLAAAQSVLAAAQLQLEQTTASIEQDQASRQNDVTVAQQAVAVAEMNLEWVEQQIRHSQIVAPFDGQITRIFTLPGRDASAFSPLITIIEPDNLIVRAIVNSRDFEKLALDQDATFSLDPFPGEVFQATVMGLPTRLVGPDGRIISDTTVLLRVDWHKGGAEAGMRSRIDLVVQRRDNALILPAETIHSVGRRRYVEILDGDVKRTRNVEIGIVSEDEVEVIAGVDEDVEVLVPD